MSAQIEDFKASVQDALQKLKVKYAKLVGRPVQKDGGTVNTKVNASYEVNLVPAVKAQMIKALKIRNLVLFICIVVAAAAGGTVLILFGVKSGQDIAMANQDSKLRKMSETMNGYDELDDLVKVQHQLAQYDAIKDKKKVLARVFGALGAMMPQNGDEVKMSELRVDLDTNELRMEGQTNAVVAPLIDYRVLEAFKKAANLTKYDYGRYVDVDGKEVPSQCITEVDEEGNALKDGSSYYAWWDLTIEGCEATRPGVAELNGKAVEYHFSNFADIEEVDGPEADKILGQFCDSEKRICIIATDEMIEITGPGTGLYKRQVCDENNENCVSEEYVLYKMTLQGDRVQYDDNGNEINPDVPTTIAKRVKIYRTPQFEKWSKDGNMTSAGTISGIEHFESKCIKYSGVADGDKTRWVSENECMLAPDELVVTESSNGRDQSDNLVLKFEARVTFDNEFFKFTNKHMMAIGPMGQNVTDSFMQIGNMFAKPAKDCEPDDEACLKGIESSKDDGKEETEKDSE